MRDKLARWQRDKKRQRGVIEDGVEKMINGRDFVSGSQT